MMLKATEDEGGIIVKSPVRAVSVDLEPVQTEEEVHIGDLDESVASGCCPVEGNSYPYKDDIKKLPYGDDGTQWTGDVWAVNPRKTAELVAVLLGAGARVSLEASCLEYDEDWGRLRKEILLDDDSGEKLRVMHPPYGDDNKVPRSWVESASSLGNFDSVEEFAENFDLNVVSDKEAKEELGLSDDDEEVDFFSSEGAFQ
jgi:hypothetical protein